MPLVLPIIYGTLSYSRLLALPIFSGEALPRHIATLCLLLYLKHSFLFLLLSCKDFYIFSTSSKLSSSKPPPPLLNVAPEYDTNILIFPSFLSDLSCTRFYSTLLNSTRVAFVLNYLLNFLHLSAAWSHKMTYFSTFSLFLIALESKVLSSLYLHMLCPFKCLLNLFFSCLPRGSLIRRKNFTFLYFLSNLCCLRF